jgi:molybdopterin synthase sulfur carrier subunit
VLKVLFFARVREALGCAVLEVEWTDEVAELDALQRFLGDRHGQRWREVLGEANLIRAVNQAVVAGNLALRDGDEVAFFPPVTGG